MKTGTLVRLKSGGPVMTVKEVSDDHWISCHWFTEGELNSGSFRQAELEAVSALGIALPTTP